MASKNINIFPIIISIAKTIGILCLINVIIHLAIYGFSTPHTLFAYLGYNCYYGIPLSILNIFLFRKLEQKLTWDKPSLRIIIGALLSFTATMATVILLNYILWILIWGNNINVLFARQNLSNYYISAFITILISLVFHTAYFYQWANKNKILNEQLQKEKIQMELNMLRAHIDPHFLFNSFNVLAGLIDENTEKAQGFLAELSNCYRYILENRNESVSTVGKEIQFAKRYFELLSFRFEDSLILKIFLKENEFNYSIPILSLQLLFENAIKHNAFNKNEKLTIQVYSLDGYLVVENNKKQKKLVEPSAKLGLENIKKHYEVISKKPIIIEDLKNRFIVKLPLN